MNLFVLHASTRTIILGSIVFHFFIEKEEKEAKNEILVRVRGNHVSSYYANLHRTPNHLQRNFFHRIRRSTALSTTHTSHCLHSSLMSSHIHILLSLEPVTQSHTHKQSIPTKKYFSEILVKNIFSILKNQPTHSQQQTTTHTHEH